jgi:restriction system protein
VADDENPWGRLRRTWAGRKRRKEQADRATREKEKRERLDHQIRRLQQALGDVTTAGERKRIATEIGKARAAALNQDVEERITDLAAVLRTGLDRKAALSFGSLKRGEPPFAPDGLDRPGPPPSWADFEPPPLGRLERLMGGTRAYERNYASQKQSFREAQAEHLAAEKDRQQALDERRRTHNRQVTRIKQHNRVVDELAAAWRTGDPDAVALYFAMVIDGSPYPDGVPHRTEVSYLPEARELIVQHELPPMEVIPTVRENRYVQTRDEIDSKDRPVSEVRKRYRDLLAQLSLRVVHEVFASDAARQVDAVKFAGRLSAIDRATGKPIRPYLVNVNVTRESFSDLVLTEVDASACLNHLNAIVSPNPWDLEEVKPLVDIEALLAKHNLTDGIDVLASLDSRPDLLSLSPKEFEHFTRQLFEAMGEYEAWNTREVKDDGVDAIVTSKDPVFGGQCIVQAKRYSKVVGVSAVQELIGAMEDKQANKAILVTTSWVSIPGHQRARRNGRVMVLEGENLKHLCKEHLDLDVLISTSPPRRHRPPDD